VGWRRDILEVVVRSAAVFAHHSSEPQRTPRKIFVLRNNDLGDLLVVTPIFDALKRKFPDTEILAGVGGWNREVLLNNPHVSRVIEVNAPWHNGFIRPQGLVHALRYIYRSTEAKALRREQADIGIDVLGSGLGSLLLMKARISYRIGVRGYAGGDSAAQGLVEYNPEEHVGRQALRFAELLGCTDLPENRPQIFLGTPPQLNGTVVIAPGAGIPEKCWPPDHFAKLAELLRGESICIVGSAKDRRLGAQICERSPKARNLCGELTLRESFGVLGGARLVICSSTMAMHVAAAFRRPAVVLLGSQFPSASQHHRQWGYPETIVLGRDKGHPDISDPAEAVARIRQTLYEQNENISKALGRRRSQ
jgi:ADP-heptose:LPS heptosyltransferase